MENGENEGCGENREANSIATSSIFSVKKGKNIRSQLLCHH